MSVSACFKNILNSSLFFILTFIILSTKTTTSVCFQLLWCNILDDMRDSYAECYSNLNCTIRYYPLNSDKSKTSQNITLIGIEGCKNSQSGKEFCTKSDALELKNIEWWTSWGTYIASSWSEHFGTQFSSNNFLKDRSAKGPFQVHAEIIHNTIPYRLDFVAGNNDTILLRIDKGSGRFLAYRATRTATETSKDLDTSYCFKFTQELLENSNWKLELLAFSDPLIKNTMSITNMKQEAIDLTLKPYLTEPIRLIIPSSRNEQKTANIEYNGEKAEYISWQEHKLPTLDMPNVLLKNVNFTDLVITPLSWKAEFYQGEYITKTILLVNTLDESINVLVTPKEDAEQQVYLKPKDMISVSYYGEALEKLAVLRTDGQETQEVFANAQGESKIDTFVFTGKDNILAVIQEESNSADTCGYYRTDKTFLQKTDPAEDEHYC